MICQRCTRLRSPSLLRSAPLRPISTNPRLLHPETPPPATSTSAAQPFSTPLTPSPSNTPGISSSPSASSKAPVPPHSSVAAGTPLKGLGYIKGQEAPVAREDSEYPEWLWGLLGPKKGNMNEEGEAGDAFAKSKKQRRIASKAARALRTGSSTSLQAVHIPLEEQSIDLPAGMGEAQARRALEAREDLTSAMRTARRAKIKENNFLSGMR